MAKRTSTDDVLDTLVPEANRPGHEQDVIPDKPLVPPAAYRVEEPPAVDAPEDGLTVRHPFRFDRRFIIPAALAGITPMTTYLELDADHLHVRFGPWSLDTPTANITDAEVTGPYALLKVIGPPHLGFKDGGVTFATNNSAGLCLTFAEPVPAIAPFGLLAHPGATVTVADPEALRRDLDRVRS